MFLRVAQVARYVASQSRLSFLPSHCPATSAASSAHDRRLLLHKVMASADERNKRTIHTAACLIIGDEVLGGKTRDTNSNYMAQFCFSLGVQLKRIEVIEDDADEIIEAVRRMSERYDFVVTSGGIGPTHDDMTYASIAKAFHLPLVLHQEAYSRMKVINAKKQPNFDWERDSPMRQAKLRMVELPTNAQRKLSEQALLPCDDLWVPVAVVNGNIHILPGVPRLFKQLLDGIKPHIKHRLADPQGQGTHRVIISTPMPESMAAGFLTEFAKKVAPMGVKVGSYPRWGKKRNTVTLVGKDKAYLDSIAPEAAQGVQGRVVQAEGEDDDLAGVEAVLG